MLKYNLKTLANGLRIITSPSKDTQTVTILVLVKVGSRYEDEEVRGASHFIEHMMFKGTRKRPNTQIISRALDAVGAEFNAYTSKDHTAYYIKLDAKNLKLGLDILSDMIFNSVFSSKEIQKEKGVILEELKMYEDNPLFSVEDAVEEILFGGKLGQLIIGTRKSVGGIDRAAMLGYQRHFYYPQNMVMALAGNIKTKDIKLAEKYFGGRREKGENILFESFSSRQKEPQLKVIKKTMEQIQLALAFSSYSYANKKLYSLILLNVILGGNMSSRLFISVREKQGLAYYIKSVVNTYEDSGCFTIQAGLDKSRLEPAIKLILTELKKIKTSGVTAVELKKAKDFLRGKLAIDLEDSAQVSSWFAKQELLTRKIMTPEQKLKKINEVTRGDIRAVARELFETKKINLALIGPIKDEMPILKILKV